MPCVHYIPDKYLFVWVGDVAELGAVLIYRKLKLYLNISWYDFTTTKCELVSSSFLMSKLAMSVKPG